MLESVYAIKISGVMTLYLLSASVVLPFYILLSCEASHVVLMVILVRHCFGGFYVI